MFSKHSQRDPKITEVEIEEALPAAPSQEYIHAEPRLDYSHYEPILDPESEFPWHHPDAQIPDAEINVPQIDMTQFYDPWDLYKGHIPPMIDDSPPRHVESQKADNQEELRKYAWDYVSPQHYQHDVAHSVEHNDTFRGNVYNTEHNTEHSYNPDQQYSQNTYQDTSNYADESQKDHTPHYNVDSFHESQYNQEGRKDQSQQDTQSYYSYTHGILHDQNEHNYEFSFEKDSEKTYYPIQQQRVEQVYYVHLDHEKMPDHHHSETEIESKMNGYGEADCEIFENIRPRHPYDGFYLRHRMTIDSRGRKVCTHEVPPTPTPSPPESPIPEDYSILQFEEEENEQSIEIEDQTGVAGNFARMVLGAGAQREALDDLTRRQGWEAGNIDYMGADAFENIWAKISQTLNQPRSSPPKQSSPPAEASVPVEQPAAPQAPVEPPSPVVAPAPAPVSPPAPVAKAPEPVPTPVAAQPIVSAPAPAAAPEPTKVVAAAPTEPTPAVEAPVAAPVAPAQPATIPIAISEAKEAAPVPKTPPPAEAPAAADAAPSTPATPKTEVTPVKGASSTDSPPLANTPSKEELPAVPAAKSTEEAAQETRL